MKKIYSYCHKGIKMVGEGIPSTKGLLCLAAYECGIKKCAKCAK